MTLRRTFVLTSDPIAARLYALLKQNWRAMADQGKPLAVTVAPYKARRTVDQNARLHAILTEIAEQAWVNGQQFAMESWKEFFKRRVLGPEEWVLPDGTTQERGRSTATLNTAEMADLQDKIEAYAVTELGVEFSQ